MKSSSTTRPSATATTITASATIRDHLSPLLPLLDAFNHRNKNQHHASHWWSHFSILRRSLRALVFSSTSRETSSSGLLSRVRWLRDRITPGAYMQVPAPRISKARLADRKLLNLFRRFSQLAADNQYAPLGLVLLAVLARISSVLSELLPPDQPPGSVQDSPAVGENSPIFQSSTEGDRGVAISRGDMDLTVPATPSITGLAALRVTAASGGPTHQSKKKRSKIKTRSKGDELSSLFGTIE